VRGSADDEFRGGRHRIADHLAVVAELVEGTPQRGASPGCSVRGTAGPARQNTRSGARGAVCGHRRPPRAARLCHSSSGSSSRSLVADHRANGAVSAPEISVSRAQRGRRVADDGVQPLLTSFCSVACVSSRSDG
jgi:hypothetical protein